MCRVHSEGTVEEHRQFWVLVAGDELSWQKMLTQVPNEKKELLLKKKQQGEIFGDFNLQEQQMVSLPGGHNLGIGLHQELVSGEISAKDFQQDLLLQVGSILEDRRLYTTSIDRRLHTV